MSVSFRNFKSAKNLLSECSEDCQCRVLQFNGREGERKKEAETREREREGKNDAHAENTDMYV